MNPSQQSLLRAELSAEHDAHHAGRPFKPHRLLRSRARRASKRNALGKRPKDPAGIERGLTAAEAIQFRVRVARGIG